MEDDRTMEFGSTLIAGITRALGGKRQGLLLSRTSKVISDCTLEEHWCLASCAFIDGGKTLRLYLLNLIVYYRYLADARALILITSLILKGRLW